MAKETGYYELPGDGPFQLAPIDRIQAVSVRLREQRVDVTALCSDHKSGYRFQFSFETVREFVEQHNSTVAMPSAPFGAVPTVVIPYRPFARPFRLFVEYVGPLHFEENYRVVEFLNERDQRIFVSLTHQAYRELLSDFKAVPIAADFLRKRRH